MSRTKLFVIQKMQQNKVCLLNLWLINRTINNLIAIVPSYSSLAFVTFNLFCFLDIIAYKERGENGITVLVGQTRSYCRYEKEMELVWFGLICLRVCLVDYSGADVKITAGLTNSWRADCIRVVRIVRKLCLRIVRKAIKNVIIIVKLVKYIICGERSLKRERLNLSIFKLLK